jgi:hypothetical protein
VARPKAAMALVLDHSGSMSQDSGDGHPKAEKLKQATRNPSDSFQVNQEEGNAYLRGTHKHTTVRKYTRWGCPRRFPRT